MTDLTSVDAEVPVIGGRPVVEMFTSTGALFDADLSFEEYERIGFFIQHEAVVSYWRLGDWCIYGERAYEEQFYQAIVPQYFDPTRIKRAISTAKTFPHDTRRESLSFEHYDEISAKLHGEPLDTMLRWLDIAEEDKLTPSELGQRIRASTAVEIEEAEPRAEIGERPEPTESTFRISFRVAIDEASMVEEIRHTLEQDLRSTLQAWKINVRGIEIGRSDS